MALPKKKPLPGGEEISLGDLIVPPILTEIWKSKWEPKKSTLAIPSEPPDKHLDRRIEKFHLNDGIEWFKVIPFKFMEK